MARVGGSKEGAWGGGSTVSVGGRWLGDTGSGGARHIVMYTRFIMLKSAKIRDVGLFHFTVLCARMRVYIIVLPESMRTSVHNLAFRRCDGSATPLLLFSTSHSVDIIVIFLIFSFHHHLLFILLKYSSKPYHNHRVTRPTDPRLLVLWMPTVRA